MTEEEKLQKIKKIEEIKQLDFTRDNEFFIDPYRITVRDWKYGKIAREKIINFFDEFFENVKDDNVRNILIQGEHLHEINATYLGYSSGEANPRGKGFSQTDLLTIYKESEKVSGLIDDIRDILVCARNVGFDKVSDLTTNIIYEELLQYTHDINKEYSLELEEKTVNKWIFNSDQKRWERKPKQVLYLNQKEILFVPEKIAKETELFSYDSFYENLVIPFYKVNAAIYNLVRTLKDGKTEKPNIKLIKQKYPKCKATVIQFKQEHPEEYKKYKDSLVNDYWTMRTIK